jgi:hypothetical protein
LHRITDLKLADQFRAEELLRPAGERHKSEAES